MSNKRNSPHSPAKRKKNGSQKVDPNMRQWKVGVEIDENYKFKKTVRANSPRQAVEIFVNMCKEKVNVAWIRSISAADITLLDPIPSKHFMTNKLRRMLAQRNALRDLAAKKADVDENKGEVTINGKEYSTT